MTWSDLSIVLLLRPPCPFDDHLLLTDLTVTDTQIFRACESITAGPSFSVASSGEVTFIAGESVVLRDGFSVASGGTFTAVPHPAPLGPC